MRARKVAVASWTVIGLLSLAGRAPAEEFQATQTTYQQVAGASSVLLTWVDLTPGDGDVDVLLDGAVIATVSPGEGGSSFTAVDQAAGRHTFEVKRGGVSLGAQEQDVLAEQPFANPEAGDTFLCAERSSDASCDVVIDWVNGFPIPSYFEVYLDDELIDTIPGFQSGAEVLAVSAGERCVTVLGFLRGPDQGFVGFFRGEPRQACCTVSCGAVGCLAPQDFTIAQVEYGAGADNAALARWKLPAGPYDRGLITAVDGVDGAELPGDARHAVFSQLSPAVHELGVTGRCGLPDGPSGAARDRLLVLTASPHPNPIAGAVACEWAPEDWGTTSFRWTNAAPSDWIAFYRVEDGHPVFLETAPGSAIQHAIHYTEAGDAFLVQFFATQEGYSYGSPRFACATQPAGNQFLRGLCNGSDAELTISSPVYGLQYLFSGGPAPPCEVACDTNGDGGVDISDMVATLAYLFQGGPPPAGWVDTTGDQVPDPTCETASVEDCTRSHAAACP
jgi:hypothetical protein